MSTPASVELPEPVRAERLPVPGGWRAGLVADPGAARGTALLVPGFTGSKEDFVAALPLLAAEGWRAVAVDQLGQHESPHADEPGAYALDRLAADVLALVEHLGGRVHLLGHSFGGLVARSAALAAPAGALASLTLLCSGPGPIPGQRAQTLRLLLQALPEHDLPVIHEQAVALAAAAGLPQPPPAVAEFLRRRFVGNDPEGLRVMGEQLLAEPDRVDALAAALGGSPVLVAHGQADDAWPHAQQAEMARRLGARYEVVPRSAHSPAVENPAATAALLYGFWGSAG
ncbi:alpha/beta fold hydrolase [Vallicoccus soli]|uniref:Alpha/beta hydrolase n=1 Tax=Vallicoccus soli TaxID=2339232 RepID=A0A3A3ZMU7_9ACTN|nr:alpha/beta hydrolase [Vallicoccus soli]RJK98065.1 alpha/beta hydrolase [Vallicoccus soli]